jgi:hypothetical protein
MSIGNCDCCDRRNVPVSHLTETYCGDVTACFLCQGDTDPDPYGEVEIDCECDGEGCDTCSGCGTVFVQTMPITLSDIEEISA